MSTSIHDIAYRYISQYVVICPIVLIALLLRVTPNVCEDTGQVNSI